jgi:hypothetical protein
VISSPPCSNTTPLPIAEAGRCSQHPARGRRPVEELIALLDALRPGDPDRGDDELGGTKPSQASATSTDIHRPAPSAVAACYRDVEAKGEPRPEEAERILRDRLRASRLRDRDEVVIVHGGPSAE